MLFYQQIVYLLLFTVFILYLLKIQFILMNCESVHVF